MLRYLKKKRIPCGQSMIEYAIILSIGSLASIPAFSMMIRALMVYNHSIAVTLNTPFP